MAFVRAHYARVWAGVRVGARKWARTGGGAVCECLGERGRTRENGLILSAYEGARVFLKDKRKARHAGGAFYLSLPEHYKRANYGAERAERGHYRGDNAAGVNHLARLFRSVAGLLPP